MHGRLYNSGVVLLWLATMTWLVKDKVLPPLLTGEPPTALQIVDAQRNASLVGWSILCNDRQIGWAISDAKQQSSDTSPKPEFDLRPRRAAIERADGHTGPGAHPRPGDDGNHVGRAEPLSAMDRATRSNKVKMDARSVVTVNALGRLTQFRSTIQIDLLPEPISVSGVADGDQVRLQTRMGNLSFRTDAYLPTRALPSDALSPQTQLPGLRGPKLDRSGL